MTFSILLYAGVFLAGLLLGWLGGALTLAVYIWREMS